MDGIPAVVYPLTLPSPPTVTSRPIPRLLSKAQPPTPRRSTLRPRLTQYPSTANLLTTRLPRLMKPSRRLMRQNLRAMRQSTAKRSRSHMPSSTPLSLTKPKTKRRNTPRSTTRTSQKASRIPTLRSHPLMTLSQSLMTLSRPLMTLSLLTTPSLMILSQLTLLRPTKRTTTRQVVKDYSINFKV